MKSCMCLSHHSRSQQPCCRIIRPSPPSAPSSPVPAHHHPPASHLLHAFQGSFAPVCRLLMSPAPEFYHPEYQLCDSDLMKQPGAAVLGSYLTTPAPRRSGLHGSLRAEADQASGSPGAAAAPGASLTGAGRSRHRRHLRTWQQQQRRPQRRPTPAMPQLWALLLRVPRTPPRHRQRRVWGGCSPRGGGPWGGV